MYCFACTECDHRWEVLQKLNDPPPHCPQCHTDTARKQVTAAGFILKGSGWYRDGYGLKE